MKKAYLIFDGRAVLGGTENAIVYEHAGHDKEKALESLKDWPDGVLYQYDIDDDGKPHNETLVKVGSVYGGNDDE